MDKGPQMLKGIRVIEFTHMVMGPTAGVILGDLGAEVIKVEPLSGDNTRRLKGSGGGYFPMYNRNKKSLSVDLKSESGIALVLRLLAGADVMVENFRPGAMDKLGLGYEVLSKLNPALVYCSLKGFLSGPYGHRTALDEVTQMMGGLAYMTGLPDRPMRAGSSVVDIGGGMFGVIAILAALHKRHETGRGRHVTSSLFETTAFMVGQHMAQERALGEPPQPMSVRRSAWSVYDLFELADGQRIFVAVVSDTQWRTFCDLFELTEFAEDATLLSNNERVMQRDRILPIISQCFARMEQQQAIQLLEHAGLPFAPVNKPSDLFEDAQLQQGGLIEVTLTDGDHAGNKACLPGLPIEVNGKRAGLNQDLPACGEHSREIAALAGYGESEIDQLIEAGVIQEI